MVQRGNKLHTRYAGSGVSCEMQAKVRHCLFCPRSPGLSHKVICRWLLLVLGSEVPSTGQATNQVQLLLVPILGPLSKRFRAYRGQMVLV